MSNIQEIRKQKNENLMELLEKLSHEEGYKLNYEQRKFNEYYDDLIIIYKLMPDKTEFRHSYSLIYKKLYYLSTFDDLNLIENLTENLTIILELIVKKAEDNKKNEWLVKYVTKLHDHVTLDVQRINSQRMIDKAIINDAKTLNDNIKEMQTKYNELDSTMQDMNIKFKENKEYVDKMDKAQIEVITVLSIFTSIVLSFVGGMAFSTSVLENIHKTDIYRLLFVMIILGLVLVNVIWGLLAIIKYINKNIEACSKPFKIINAILIILLALNMLAYKTDVFEAENKMNAQLSSETNGAVNITNSNIDNEESLKENTKTSETEESEETESTKKSKEKTDTKTTKK